VPRSSPADQGYQDALSPKDPTSKWKSQSMGKGVEKERISSKMQMVGPPMKEERNRKKKRMERKIALVSLELCTDRCEKKGAVKE